VDQRQQQPHRELVALHPHLAVQVPAAAPGAARGAEVTAGSGRSAPCYRPRPTQSNARVRARALVPGAGARLAVCQGPGSELTPSRQPLSMNSSAAQVPLLGAAALRCSARVLHAARARACGGRRTGTGPTECGTRRSCAARRSGTIAPAPTPARARARQPAARLPSPLSGRLPGGCATAVAISLPPVPAVAHELRTSERLLSAVAFSPPPTPAAAPASGTAPRGAWGRTLGIARTLARLSGSGWSRRVRRSLPRSRWPPRPRDSSLFTARWPVPPPADVPTRPAAYSSCATRPRLTQRQSRPGALIKAGARRAPLTDPGQPVPGSGHVRGQATRPEHVAGCKQC